MSRDDTDSEDIKNQAQLRSVDDDYAEIFCNYMGNITYRDVTQFRKENCTFFRDYTNKFRQQCKYGFNSVDLCQFDP